MQTEINSGSEKLTSVLITGGMSGLGKEIGLVLKRQGARVIVFDKECGDDVRAPGNMPQKLAAMGFKRLDILINCAGINEIEWLEKMEEDLWDRVMDTNAKGVYMMTQAVLPLLIASKGTVLNIVSNASHMPMTASLAYCCSKAAAAMATKQLARELTKKFGITVFSISPNKLKGTAMSTEIERQVIETRGWTPEFAAAYQKQALLTGEETPPENIAKFIGFLLSNKDNHCFLSGCDIPYGL